jgi:serine/threonine protein phosphatase PrpC
MEKEHREILNTRIELLKKLQSLEQRENELTHELNEKKNKFRQMIEEKQGKKKLIRGLSRNFSIIFENPQQVQAAEKEENEQKQIIVQTKVLQRIKTKPRLLSGIDLNEPATNMYSPRLWVKINPKLYDLVTTLVVVPPRTKQVQACFEGPMTDEKKGHSSLERPPEVKYQNHFSGRTISTYPPAAIGTTREGDPICDRFYVEFYPERTIFAIADGCNWGIRPREAAIKATKAFANHLATNQDFVDLKECGHILLHGITASHNAIIQGKEDVWDAGTTTLLGGIIVEIKPNPNLNNNGSDLKINKWGFICVSVGDCKAYYWNSVTKKVTDITEGNRQNLTDPTDPGGRIGPYLNGGTPDLRNLELYFQDCNEGDLILLVSDGLHDNLDPQSLGKSPREFQIEADTWSDAEKNFLEQAEEAKNAFRRKILEKEIETLEQNNNLNPSSLSQVLVDFCDNLTAPSRDFMKQNPGKKLPNDYKLYPGKMDHTTCVVLKIQSSE